MPTTPRTSTPYPAYSDVPDVPADLQALILALEPYTNLRYASTSARDADITSPIAGMQCSVAGVPYVYTGSAWVAVLTGGPQYTTYIKQKTVTQSVTNSITLVDDSELQVNLDVGLYRVELNMIATSAVTTPDIQVMWTFSGTATSQRQVIGPGPGNNDVTGSTTTAGSGIIRSSSHNLGTAVRYGVDGNATSMITEDILFTVTVAGVLKLQWAQAVANATSTNVPSGARIYVTPLTAL
jgi:hypothetical protein